MASPEVAEICCFVDYYSSLGANGARSTLYTTSVVRATSFSVTPSVLPSSGHAMMLVTFALNTMRTILNKRPLVQDVHVLPSPQLDQMTDRFETLRKNWNESQRLDRSELPELEELFRRTGIVMKEAELLTSDIKSTLPKAPFMVLERARLAQLFSRTRKAIRAGQKITHRKAFPKRTIPRKPRGETPPSDEWLADYDSRKKHNRKANALVDRRKQPLQCCMFVAVAFSQLLEENDMLAEYESEIVGECFNRALKVDDGKMYVASQIRDHSLARLLPPPERYPKLWIHEGDEGLVVPCIVRNPLRVGAPVVTNQLCPGASESQAYHARPSPRARLTKCRSRIRKRLHQLESQQHPSGFLHGERVQRTRQEEASGHVVFVSFISTCRGVILDAWQGVLVVDIPWLREARPCWWPLSLESRTAKGIWWRWKMQLNRRHISQPALYVIISSSPPQIAQSRFRGPWSPTLISLS